MERCPGGTCCQQSGFGADVPLAEVAHQRIDTAEFEVTPEDQTDPFGLVFDDRNLIVLSMRPYGSRQKKKDLTGERFVRP